MNILTKRNAFLGWLVSLVARLRNEQRAERHRVRNGVLAGLGVAAGAAAAAVLWTRRAHDEPARA
jgi:hypothetical protein